jgi:hypothetical protein
MAASLGAENAGGNEANNNNFIFGDSSGEEDNGQADAGLIQQFAAAMGFGGAPA